MPFDLGRLDPDQRRAVTAPDGAVLVFAGAGSGKTSTLTARVAWLIDQGVPAWQIMAVTFTRKAAGEMRDRLQRLIGPEAATELRVGTFHAQMAAAIRREGPALAPLGRSGSYAVWDEDDRERALKTLIRDAGLDALPGVTAGAVAERISRWKNERADPATVPVAEPLDRIAARLWPRYEAAIAASDAFDFDDLLAVPVRLLEDDPMLRVRWSGRIRHLLVDEFQDTNPIQLRLVELLSSVHGNLFVVGDDAQSIYGFRGARVEHILGFRERFPQATTVSLLTNYRSTGAICDVANAVLAASSVNLHKELRASASAPSSGRPRFVRFGDDRLEAATVASELARLHQAGRPLTDAAILVRTRAQTRPFEAALLQARIPYRVLGGRRFWEREEVRDLVAHLRALVNPRDAMAYGRALTKPARGVGEKLLDALRAQVAEGADWPTAIDRVVAAGGGTTKGRAALAAFAANRRAWATRLATLPPAEIVRGMLAASGLEALYGDGSEEGTSRVENLREVINAAAGFAVGELSTMLETAALEPDQTGTEGPPRGVTIATLHAAKGLEWTFVFLVGAEEGFLPHDSAKTDAEVEEERRIFYVGVTRARRTLVITAAASRFVNGARYDRRVSRFVVDARAVLDCRGEGAPGRPGAAGSVRRFG